MLFTTPLEQAVNARQASAQHTLETADAEALTDPQRAAADAYGAPLVTNSIRIGLPEIATEVKTNGHSNRIVSTIRIPVENRNGELTYKPTSQRLAGHPLATITGTGHTITATTTESTPDTVAADLAAWLVWHAYQVVREYAPLEARAVAELAAVALARRDALADADPDGPPVDPPAVD